MTDYSELVKALRVCASAGECKTCERDLYCEPTKMLSDAAAAIEALQAEIRESMQKCAECGDRMVEPKQGEWEVKGANRIDCSVCGHSVCFAFGLTDGSFGLYKYCPNCGAKMEVQE